MKFDMFSEVQLTEDLPESNLSRGTHAIIVDYCPSLHYSPTGKNLIVRTSQKTDCFSARSLDELLAKAFEDFPKSS
jgi:hypothetical protein